MRLLWFFVFSLASVDTCAFWAGFASEVVVAHISVAHCNSNQQGELLGKMAFVRSCKRSVWVQAILS